jgi:arginine exporter protein ArgO
MINAGIAEYAAILTGIGGGTTITSFEPALNVIVIVGGIIFLFWLVVFKL